MSVKYSVTMCVCECFHVNVSCVYSTPLSVRLTSDLVQALSGNVVVLIDPFSVTFEVDLGGR